MLVSKRIPSWGCPSTSMSDDGFQFFACLAQAVYALLGTHKVAKSSFHPNGNVGTERINHTMS